MLFLFLLSLFPSPPPSLFVSPSSVLLSLFLPLSNPCPLSHCPSTLGRARRRKKTKTANGRVANAVALKIVFVYNDFNFHKQDTFSEAAVLCMCMRVRQSEIISFAATSFITSQCHVDLCDIHVMNTCVWL